MTETRGGRDTWSDDVPMHDGRKTQQDQVYDAQDHMTRGRAFASIDEAQAFVDGLRYTLWWKTLRHGVRKVIVQPARKNARYSMGDYDGDGIGHMTLSSIGLNEQTVVHELAHVMAGARHGSQSHDPWFCRVLVELVHLIMGPDEMQRLVAGFEEHGVDFDADGLTERSKL